MAADGYTYEREAITAWLANSNRSPMTNQELPNKDLRPNYAIKGLLQVLTESQQTETENPCATDDCQT